MTSSDESLASLSSCSEELIPISNPIGTLQELCNLKRFSQPRYKLAYSEGPSHALTFCMECALNGKVNFGRGTSKKAAKHKAAHHMLKRLNYYNSVSRSSQSERNHTPQFRLTDIQVGLIHRVLKGNDDAPESEAGSSTKGIMPTWQEGYKRVATCIPRQEYKQVYAESPF